LFLEGKAKERAAVADKERDSEAEDIFCFFRGMHQRTLVELKHVAAAVIKPLKHVAALTKPLSSTSQP
jgi:hypothetical protein